MASRRALKVVCGIAGASAVLVAAERFGSFGDSDAGSGSASAPSWWPVFGVLRAAQPAAPTAARQHGQHTTVALSGNGWDSNWDKRDPITLMNSKKKRDKDTPLSDDPSAELEKKKPKATRHIILIRHSQYNLKGESDKERFLTSLGREQAELTGQRLATLGLKYDFIVHSTMTRATETANIISKHFPDVEKVSCDLLREGSPIEPVPQVGHSKPEFVYHEEGARIEAAFRRYIHRADVEQKEDSYDIIVCHANVIRYFVCRALQFPPEGWLRMSLNHGSITWLYVRPSGRVGLRMLGDAGFMPPEKLTRS
ncbi:serine/threonine-protein phosphatase PGAM5, mitochondrial-like [Scleropages formosus]|uniref:Serine/threonine-protein phosphatase PGAM5, mitochondrial n=2 Tax=Scleropages formosus TaxID=113540 RepID=A0A8C9V6E1_SCLFO|nr:serine/threonine-protein phosphatase PGAM5, mitochondrial-like [Scleropages formosus]